MLPVDAGIYYYDPVAHRLVLVNDAETDRECLLHVASRATGMEARPDVLITVTARFRRKAWKYRAIANATTLRHTGVLHQTMYQWSLPVNSTVIDISEGAQRLAAELRAEHY
ncbi:hypothetical protein ACFRAO_17140 [Streptomyces sp. NPDC056656]|uniref:hypothetical protein n=1 Tax=Streptomyces sp. NPDC056656 TaxID=3345895 RepID=UPI0036952722